jgi:hypothetical protein
MRRVVVAVVAWGLLLSSMTAMAKKKKDNKALQDAKEAQQYGGAKFDGSKVKTNSAVPIGGQKAAPDYKALNKAEQDRQKGVSQKLHLDKPTKPIPTPTTKATPPPKRAPAPKTDNKNKK